MPFGASHVDLKEILDILEDCGAISKKDESVRSETNATTAGSTREAGFQ